MPFDRRKIVFPLHFKVILSKMPTCPTPAKNLPWLPITFGIKLRPQLTGKRPNISSHLLHCQILWLPFPVPGTTAWLALSETHCKSAFPARLCPYCLLCPERRCARPVGPFARYPREVEHVRSGARLTAFQPSSAAWPWESYSASLCLHYCICKVAGRTAATSECCW